MSHSRSFCEAIARREYIFTSQAGKLLDVWMRHMWEMEKSRMMSRFWFSFQRTSLLGIWGRRRGKRARNGEGREEGYMCISVFIDLVIGYRRAYLKHSSPCLCFQLNQGNYVKVLSSQTVSLCDRR